MKRKFVIDTSVYKTYAAYNKIYRLIYAINNYELKVFVNDGLLGELENNNIADCLRIEDADPAILMQAIKSATIHIITEPNYNKSPDPKDNFL